ncbi:MAG TPA: molybdate ABC transporter substrate-binding protein [Verrucomicrobiae bacterium]|nr:molybdate ABC transporter substrate-binding protein [Verrucomicrobiae bacterium]
MVLPVSGAEPLNVAVASNFADSARRIAEKFTAVSKIEVQLSGGSSGKLYAQIENGAPFDVFLSADDRPRLLEEKGLAMAGTRFTYAIGRLALWSADATLQGQDCKQVLMDGRFRHIAIASPKTAPYGAAAVSVLESLGLPPAKLGDRLVTGENIAQTLQFVASGSAQLGFVAQSQLRGPNIGRGSCRWDVPAALHAPIEQQAVLLARGAKHPAARDFLRHLRSEAIRAQIRLDGYDLNP